MKTHIRINCALLLAVIFAVPLVYSENPPFYFKLLVHDLSVLVNEQRPVWMVLSGNLNKEVNLTFVKQHENLISLDPPSLNLGPAEENRSSYSILVKGLSPGHLEVTAITTPNDSWIAKDVFLRVTVANSQNVIYVSLVFGWMYFLAWSISFYPQIYSNFRRKSVVGLNFDFLSLNVVGFTLYSVFNIGLFWIPEIQQEYSNRYPRGLNPVLTNDVFFSLHATFATLVTIIQCFLYERADQRVSITARGILSLFFALIIIFVGLAIGNVIQWLDFLYYCSYIKLAITLIKYIPQAVMNYRRKSTVGWSIGNILLDFLGGMLSMMQMILNAYNYDDWESIFGDPTKFGLGLFSVCFDIFFMLQHYVFYSAERTEKHMKENPSNLEKLLVEK